MSETVFFVSPSGSDKYDGTCPEFVGSKKGPFATIEKAKSEVRKKLTAKRRKPIKVLIRGGRYELKKTLIFTPEDSGTSTSPVVYAAYPCEAPELSGGRQIKDWKEGTVNGKNCWISELKRFPKTKLNFTQLFVNGERRERPRFPREGYYNFTGVPKADPGAPRFFNGPDRAFFKKGEIKKWRNIEDIDLIALQLWFDTHHKIKKIDLKKNEVHFVNKSLGSLKDEKSEMARYCVENVFEALENPGEWYLDRKKSLLYYIPMPDEKIEDTQIVAPALESIVKFKGTEKKKVSNIRLENLNLKHAEWQLPEDSPGSVQAAFQVPGAVIFDHASECVLYGCEVSKVSQYGVQVTYGSTKNKIVACAIHDLGGGGVRIDNEWLKKAGSTNAKAVPRTKNSVQSATTVSDCSIHDTSKIYLSAIGIFIGNAGRNRILYNHIYNVNYTGISVGWTWSYNETATVDNLIKGNHIHHINWNRLLSDNGGIYTLGLSPGTVYSDNHIHHVNCYGYGGWGIYHDQSTSEQIVENNIVHHTRHAGFFTHYGRDNIVRNNIFALADSSHVSPGSRKENHRSTLIEKNIIYWDRKVPGIGTNMIKDWDTPFYLFRKNLFWGGGADIEFDGGKTISDWQEKGQFLGAVVADPLFVDPESGDFSLRQDSPASLIGFKPLDASKAGPRFKGRRPTSFTDWPLEKESEKPVSLSTLEIDEDNKNGKLTISNPGLIPVSGEVKLKAGPGRDAKLSGKTELVLKNLAPGKSKTINFSLQLSEDAGMFYIETVPKGKGIMSSYIYNIFGERFTTPEVAKCSKPGDIPKKLSQIPWMHMTDTMGFTLAEARFALAGNDLLMQVKSVDGEITPIETLPYKGSCVELFLSPKNKISQFFLVPSKKADSATFGRLVSGESFPEASIKGDCRPLKDGKGYEMMAIIPLGSAGIPDDFKEFYLEVVINGYLGSSTQQTRTQLFKAITPFSSTQGCARCLRA